MSFRALALISDLDMCWRIRIEQPFRALAKYGVELTQYCFLPSSPTKSQFDSFVEMLTKFDILIIQRCYLLPVVRMAITAAQVRGVVTIFSTDDDYCSLEAENQAFFAVARDQLLVREFFQHQAAGNMEEAQKLIPALLKSREEGLEDYKEILKMVDWVEASTQELAQTIYPHNKNVIVFENNVEKVFPWKDCLDLRSCLKDTIEEGRIRIEIPNTLGLFTFPNHERLADDKFRWIPRIGYTSTPTHKFSDFNTIKDGLNEFHEKYLRDHMLIFWDDPNDAYFYSQIADKTSTFIIPPTQYEKYVFNLRNIDIGLCPLYPSIFNMSKSSLKALEYSTWMTPALCPDYITYTREWKNEQTCLTYRNKEEFVSQLERLTFDHDLRLRLGQAAYEYTLENRLESKHAPRRLEFYSGIIRSKKRLECFLPNKEKVC